MLSTKNKPQNLLEDLKKFRFQKKNESEETEVDDESKEIASNSVVHAVSSESEENTRESDEMPKISFCVGSANIPEDSLDSYSEVNGTESRSESSKSSLQISNVHTMSDSDSHDSISRVKKKAIIISDSEDEDSVEAPKKYSRIKTLSSFQFKKKSDTSNKNNEKKNENGLKRKAESPPKAMKDKKAKKKQKHDRIEEVDDWSDNVYDSDADSDTEVSNYMSSSKKKVFDFFNNATTVELLQIPSCTQIRVNAILEARPFEGWRDLVNKLENGKHLNGQILNAALDVLKTRSIVSQLMEKCLKIAVSTEKAIAAGSTHIKQQPSILTPGLQLKSYQMVGLNWFVVMHHQGLSGILADEMGLGKTIQVIAFLSYLKEFGEVNHPHLIVVPATTLENWAVEFARWSPSLRIVVYHGSPDERRTLRVQWFKEKFKSMDVIITTYKIIGTNYEERKMFRIISLDYVVFDEAHMLKSMNTQRYGHLFSINAKRRILLTGTPLQNNLLELMSLLNFVMPNMFSDKIQYIKSFFSKNSKLPVENLPTFEQEQIDLAKRIMKPFVLRRLKSDVLSDLPKKTSSVLKCPLAEGQKAKYDEYIGLVKDSAANDRDNYNYMSTFMQLRRLANHPLACRYLYEDAKLQEMAERLAYDMDYKETNKDYVFEDLSAMSDHEIHKLTDNYRCIKKFKLEDKYFLESGKFQKLDELLPKLKEEGHRVLIFSQFVFMLDILEEYLRIRDYDYLRLDGSTRSLDRQELIDNYNEDSSIFVFLLTTKAGGIGINLTTADTVIIHDVDFNPYNDKQAEDRCHRLGQTKPVHIMRLVSESTVEEHIYAQAQNKLNLEQELIATEEETGEETKTVEDLLKKALGI